MIKAAISANSILKCSSVSKNCSRFAFFDKISDSWNAFMNPDPPKPPYSHICQIGDPVLRTPAHTIDQETLKLPIFKQVLKHMQVTMKKFGLYGIAAPQIGLPWRIFLIEIRPYHVEFFDEKTRKLYDIHPVPLMTFINPTVRVKSDETVSHPESCASVFGFSGVVSRATEVEVTALNPVGQQFKYSAKGWTARVIQHEYDHLQGVLYTDKMDPLTLCCVAWEKINKYGGRIELRYRAPKMQ